MLDGVEEMRNKEKESVVVLLEPLEIPIPDVERGKRSLVIHHHQQQEQLGPPTVNCPKRDTMKAFSGKGKKITDVKGRGGKKKLEAKEKEEEEEWEVELILDDRILEGELQYYVKWMHWPSSSNTWEPQRNLKKSQSRIAEYQSRAPLQRKYLKWMNGETGFNLGLTCKRVRGVVELEECPEGGVERLFYIVEWEGSSRVDEIPSVLAIAKIPQLVIKYWESITEWGGRPRKRRQLGYRKTDERNFKGGKTEEDVRKETLESYEQQFKKCNGGCNGG